MVIKKHFRKTLLCFSIIIASLMPNKSHAQYIHIDISAGIQYFDGMSEKIGWDYNIGGRLLLNEKWFLGALVHQGINKGKYDGMYAGEPSKLEHERNAAFFGLGPGYMYKVNDALKAFGQVLGGWGAMETIGNPNVKVVNDIESHTYKGFSAAVVLGVEQNLNGHVLGVNLTTHCIDSHIMPSINLKYGIYFVL